MSARYTTHRTVLFMSLGVFFLKATHFKLKTFGNMNQAELCWMLEMFIYNIHIGLRDKPSIRKPQKCLK